jgi:(4S)-4-hydroxy-5-phosphonooxypentane-2,3-dione isomerase
MFVIVAEFRTVPDKVDAFREVIGRQAERSVAEEPGCKQFDVGQDEADPTRFVLYEVYVDAAAFDEHIGLARFKKFQNEVRPMLAGEPLVARLVRLFANP